MSAIHKLSVVSFSVLLSSMVSVGCSDQVAKAASVDAASTFAALHQVGGGVAKPVQTATLKASIAWELNQVHVGLGAIQGDMSADAVRTMLGETIDSLKAAPVQTDKDLKRFAENLAEFAGRAPCTVAPASGQVLDALKVAAAPPPFPAGVTDEQKAFFAPFVTRIEALSDFSAVTCASESKVHLGFARDGQTGRLIPLRLN